MQEEPFDSLSETSKYDLAPKAAEDFQQRELVLRRPPLSLTFQVGPLIGETAEPNCRSDAPRAFLGRGGSNG
jgi:hypothetical protein